MRTIDIIQRAWRNLSRAKLRTSLTALAISIGAFVIMTSIALGTGIRKYTDGLIGTNMNERTLGVTKEKEEFVKANIGGSGLREYSENYDDTYGMELLDNNDIEALKKVDGVEQVFAYQFVNMKYFTVEGSDKKWSSTINTYDPMIINETVSGKLPERGTPIADNQVMIPEGYLEKLGLTKEEIIGKKIYMVFSLVPTKSNIEELKLDPTQMNPENMANLEKVLEKIYEFEIVAVSKKVPMSLSGSKLFISENRYFEIGKAVNKGTENEGKYIQLSALIAEDLTPEEAKQRIEEQTKLSAMTAREMQEMVSQVTNVLQIVVVGFGILSLLVSVFGIVNTMYVSVLERTKQVGLMKALGMQGRHVAKMFRYEAAWIGFLGAGIGVGLSWIIGIALNPWISEKVGFKAGDGIFLLHYEILPAVALIFILVLVAIISGWLPAHKAAKLDPIEALRTE